MKTKFFHVDHKHTFACELNEKREVTAYAVSSTHPKDQFCRKTGRIKAEGRLQSPKWKQIPAILMQYEPFREQVFEDYALEELIDITSVEYD